MSMTNNPYHVFSGLIQNINSKLISEKNVLEDYSNLRARIVKTKNDEIEGLRGNNNKCKQYIEQCDNMIGTLVEINDRIVVEHLTLVFGKYGVVLDRGENRNLHVPIFVQSGHETENVFDKMLHYGILFYDFAIFKGFDNYDSDQYDFFFDVIVGEKHYTIIFGRVDGFDMLKFKNVVSKSYIIIMKEKEKETGDSILNKLQTRCDDKYFEKIPLDLRSVPSMKALIKDREVLLFSDLVSVIPASIPKGDDQYTLYGGDLTEELTKLFNTNNISVQMGEEDEFSTPYLVSASNGESMEDRCKEAWFVILRGLNRTKGIRDIELLYYTIYVDDGGKKVLVYVIFIDSLFYDVSVELDGDGDGDGRGGRGNVFVVRRIVNFDLEYLERFSKNGRTQIAYPPSQWQDYNARYLAPNIVELLFG